VLRHLGFRVLPAAGLAPDQQGPVAPPMMTPLRRRPVGPPRSASPRNPSGPFAALAALRR
jgi:ATP-dependent RNA helicase SUPV3L1/SUV3